MDKYRLRVARAYVSWYCAGVVAVDVSRAPRLRRVGQFTAPGTFFCGVVVDPKAQTLYATARDRLSVLLPTGSARS